MRGVASAYRRLLANRPLTRLLAGEFVSSIGDWLYLVALLVILYERTEDAVLLGIVGAARVLPYVFLSIPAGIVADRFDRRLVLLVTDLLRGGLMLVLAWLVATDGSIEAIVVVTILATCCSSFFGPAIGAYLPSLVRDEADLGPANTAYAALDNVAFVIGPAAAAVILGLTDSLALAFILNALSFAFVAAILWGLPSSRPSVAPPAGDAGSGEGGPARAPARATFDWRAARRPLGGLLTFDLVESFVFGGIGVLTVVIAFELLGGGEEATGALNAAVGVGGLVGALVSGVLVLRRRLAPPLVLGALVMGVGVAVLGATSSLGVAMASIAAAALGSLLVGIVGETLFQRIVPDAVRGRAIGVLETGNVLAYAAGALLLPMATEWLGLGTVLVASGVVIAIAGTVAVVALGPWAVQAPADTMQARLVRLPAFNGLSPARLEAAERRAVLVPMRTGDVLIRQGDRADRFYVVGEGEVEVTQVPPEGGEARTLRRMGVGEGFGEIGLLTGSPRTATVTATCDGTLIALDGDDFLALVSGVAISFPFLELHRGGGTATAGAAARG